MRWDYLKILLFHLYIPAAVIITFGSVAILKGNFSGWETIRDLVSSFIGTVLIVYAMLLVLAFGTARRLHSIDLRRLVSRNRYVFWLVFSSIVFAAVFYFWKPLRLPDNLLNLVSFFFAGCIAFPAAESLGFTLAASIKAFRLSRR